MKKFRLVMGIFPGYFPGNNKKVDLQEFEQEYQRIAYDIQQKTDVFVTSILTLGKALYPEKEGCPNGGESVVCVEGNFFPHIGAVEKWEDAVMLLAKALQQRFQQHMVTLEFSEVRLQLFQEFGVPDSPYR